MSKLKRAKSFIGKRILLPSPTITVAVIDVDFVSQNNNNWVINNNCREKDKVLALKCQWERNGVNEIIWYCPGSRMRFKVVE